MPFNLQEIQRIVGAQPIAEEVYKHIRYICIDSRSAVNDQTLFIAIKGVRNNGHNYIADVYERGCRSFLVTEKVDVSKYPGATFLLVEDSILTLQQLATSNRKQYTYPISARDIISGAFFKGWIRYICNHKCKSQMYVSGISAIYRLNANNIYKKIIIN
jgi:UDP-N-acetylmuramyl tripeptide synthase